MQENRAGRTHAGTGGNAEQVRGDEGVAEDPLVRGAGEGEGSTHAHGTEGTRQAHMKHDGFNRARPGNVRVDAGNLPDKDLCDGGGCDLVVPQAHDENPQGEETGK